MTSDIFLDMGLTIIVFLVCMALYLLPWLIARYRDMHGTGLLLFVNLTFGWSLIGWLACLLWGALGQTKAQKRFYEGTGYRLPSLR